MNINKFKFKIFNFPFYLLLLFILFLLLRIINFIYYLVKLTLMLEIPKSTCFMCDLVFNSNDNIPKVLPCGHTFCDKCIEKEYKKKNHFLCKFCDKKIYTHYSEYLINEYILTLEKKITALRDLSQVKIYFSNKLKEVKQINYYLIKNEYEDLLHPKPKPKIQKSKSEKIKETQNESINQYKTSVSFSNSKNKTNDTSFVKKNSMGKYNNIKPPKKKKSEYFIKPKNQEFSLLFNYFEVMKYIIKYSDKYRNVGTFGKIIKIIYQYLSTTLILILNYFLLKDYEFSLFYMFISILYINENNIYDIVLKLKMYSAMVFLLLFEDFIYKIGLYYLNNFTIFYNILIGIRTIYTIFVLGNELTLNAILSRILWTMSLGNLLIK